MLALAVFFHAAFHLYAAMLSFSASEQQFTAIKLLFNDGGQRSVTLNTDAIPIVLHGQCLQHTSLAQVLASLKTVVGMEETVLIVSCDFVDTTSLQIIQEASFTSVHLLLYHHALEKYNANSHWWWLLMQLWGTEQESSILPGSYEGDVVFLESGQLPQPGFYRTAQILSQVKNGKVKIVNAQDKLA